MGKEEEGWVYPHAGVGAVVRLKAKVLVDGGEGWAVPGEDDEEAGLQVSITEVESHHGASLLMTCVPEAMRNRRLRNLGQSLSDNSQKPHMK